MSRDSLLVIVVLVALIGAGVVFYVMNNADTGEADFVPADTSVVDMDKPDDRVARRSSTSEVDPRTDVRARPETIVHPGAAPEDVAAPEQGLDAMVSGMVIDPVGKPVGNAAVTLCVDVSDLTHQSLQGEVYASTRTDVSGRFALAGVSVEDRYLLRVDHEDFASEFVPKLALKSGQRRVQNVQLRNGQVLKGHVSDLQGAPISAVEILVFDQMNRAMDPTQDVERIQFTDVNGDFEFKNLNPGYKRVTARKAGHASSTQPAVQVIEGKAATPLTFQLAEGSQIVGVVREAEGPPIADVIVTAQPIRRNDRNAPVSNYPAVKSDEQGRFTYDGLAPGTYALVCHKPGYGSGRRTTAKTGEEVVQIEMERQPIARGQVIDSQTGQPITKFSVILSRSEYLVFAGHRVTQRFEDAQGHFEYADLQGNGDFYLFAQANDYAGGRSELITIVPGQDIDGIVIPLRKGSSAKGRVVDSAGEAVKGATVELVPQTQHEGEGAVFIQMLQRNMKTASKSVTTGADGTYVFEHVLDGNYKIRADHSIYAQGESKNSVFVPPDDEVQLPDLVLMRGGTIRGVVRDKEGNVEVGSKVQVTEKGMFGGNNYSAVTGSDGAFTVEHVRPGIYLVNVVERAGQASFDLFAQLLGQQSRPEVIVGDGETVDVTF